MNTNEERLLNAELLVEHWMDRYYAADGQREKVEQRIKELEAVNTALLEALKEIEWSNNSKWQSDRARAAIAQAEGKV